ncbi:MAG: helix-turn-helix domain-containing protein [Christensenellales bacterium]
MKLKDLRKDFKLTQQQLADYLGVAESTYRGYENGTSEPSIETLKKLATYYGVTLDYLCEFKTVEIPSISAEKDKKVINMFLKMTETKKQSIRAVIEAIEKSN